MRTIHDWLIAHPKLRAVAAALAAGAIVQSALIARRGSLFALYSVIDGSVLFAFWLSHVLYVRSRRP